MDVVSSWRHDCQESDTDTDSESEISHNDEVLVECVDSTSNGTAEPRNAATRTRVIEEIIGTEERFCSALGSVVLGRQTQCNELNSMVLGLPCMWTELVIGPLSQFRTSNIVRAVCSK